MVVRDTIDDLVGPGLFSIRAAPLEARHNIMLCWVTRERAAEWYMTAPEEAPEDLRPHVAQYDLTEAPTPPVFDPPATTEPKADGRTPEATADRIELASVTRAPSIVEREAPSWNKEMKTLTYKGKTNMFRKDAESVSEVFDWFQNADWHTAVKIQDYDIIVDIVHINNIVKRAREKANSLGFTITRNGETLEWADKSTLSDN